jgi:hypothetical protein
MSPMMFALKAAAVMPIKTLPLFLLSVRMLHPLNQRDDPVKLFLKNLAELKPKASKKVGNPLFAIPAKAGTR